MQRYDTSSYYDSSRGARQDDIAYAYLNICRCKNTKTFSKIIVIQRLAKIPDRSTVAAMQHA